MVFFSIFLVTASLLSPIASDRLHGERAPRGKGRSGAGRGRDRSNTTTDSGLQPRVRAVLRRNRLILSLGFAVGAIFALLAEPAAALIGAIFIGAVASIAEPAYLTRSVDKPQEQSLTALSHHHYPRAKVVTTAALVIALCACSVSVVVFIRCGPSVAPLLTLAIGGLGLFGLFATSGFVEPLLGSNSLLLRREGQRLHRNADAMVLGSSIAVLILQMPVSGCPNYSSRWLPGAIAWTLALLWGFFSPTYGPTDREHTASDQGLDSVASSSACD